MISSAHSAGIEDLRRALNLPMSGFLRPQHDRRILRGPPSLPASCGACDCLSKRLPLNRTHHCDEVGEVAHACLGNDGSERLWRNQQCLPYRVNLNGKTVSIEYTTRGCTMPNDGELRLVSFEQSSRAGSSTR